MGGRGRDVTTEPGSTVPRRQLGRYLRKLREDAGITIRAAADELEWSTQKIWRIENGSIAMRRERDIRAMCEVYNASAEMTEVLKGLGKETIAKGWWHSYGVAVPSWFELYVGLEAAASRLRQYESELIPGLLQVKAYATEVIEHNLQQKSIGTTDRRVAVRLERQGLLTRKLPPPPRLEAVINEAVLKRSITNRDAMAAQLEHVLDVSTWANVSVRVLPFEAGLHGAVMAGAFVILDFPPNGDKEPEPSTVYGEGLTGSLYLDKPEEVAAYDAVWRRIEDVSLGEAESRERITTAIMECERQ
jgi:transcriptional regulator with XRE-family HTH domain